MRAEELIDAYVADVVGYLPRGQRRDVAQELRALLTEETDGAARERDLPRAEAAREVLAGFGRPAEAAARYGTPVSLIDPADTRGFLILAGVGSALIVFAAVLRGLAEPARAFAESDVYTAVLAWWGVLVMGFAVAAWARRRRPQGASTWRPRWPADRISRPGRLAALAFFMLGTVALIDPAGLMTRLSGSDVAAPYFAYDDAFLRQRGPVVLTVIALGLAIQAVIVVQGRRRPLTERADLVHGLTVCIVLTWIVAAGPIFRASTTDQAVKGAIALIILGALIDLAVRARKQHVLEAVRGR